jgi:hypothetical protein
MPSAEETREEANHSPFYLTGRGTVKLRPGAKARSVSSARSITPYELDLSGSQLLLASAFLCTAGLVLWSLLRLWLFAQ